MTIATKDDAATRELFTILTPEQIDSVSGGDRVVIVGCTTRPPIGGYPPGTVVWNPWIGQPYPMPQF